MAPPQANPQSLWVLHKQTPIHLAVEDSGPPSPATALHGNPVSALHKSNFRSGVGALLYQGPPDIHMHGFEILASVALLWSKGLISRNRES